MRKSEFVSDKLTAFVGYFYNKTLKDLLLERFVITVF